MATGAAGARCINSILAILNPRSHSRSRSASTVFLPAIAPPDAPALGAAGQPMRLFNLFKGPHWTLFGYEVEGHDAFPARAGLHIHTVGAKGDIIDDAGHIENGYGLATGDWVLVRPDGYVGAIVSSSEASALNAYLDEWASRPTLARRGWSSSTANVFRGSVLPEWRI